MPGANARSAGRARSPPGPAGPLTAYQLLTTAIRILTPAETDEEFDPFGWFASAVSTIGDVLSTTLDGIGSVLHEAAVVVEAGAHFLQAADHLL